MKLGASEDWNMAGGSRNADPEPWKLEQLMDVNLEDSRHQDKNVGRYLR
jgi:hypothetical protein